MLSDDQLERYARHAILDNVGEIGQEKILQAKVLVIGAGGLGSPLLLYLAGDGVGCLGIVDFDSVDISNLHRQIIHTQDDIGRAKVISAKEKIEALNDDVTVHVYRNRLNSDTIEEIFTPYDIIVDGCDNFATRYLVNQTAWRMGKILVSGAVSRFEGQVIAVNPKKNTACYKCVFPSIPNMENISQCDTVGVFGATTGIIGTMQALEVLKIILQIGTPLYNKIMMVDLLNSLYKTFQIRKDKQCTVCTNRK